MHFFSLVAFITTFQYNTKNFWFTLELKLCLSNFGSGIERQKEGYQGYKYYFNFHASSSFIIKTLFMTNFRQLQNEADCLSVNSLIDRDSERLFFMS